MYVLREGDSGRVYVVPAYMATDNMEGLPPVQHDFRAPFGDLFTDQDHAEKGKA